MLRVSRITVTLMVSKYHKKVENIKTKKHLKSREKGGDRESGRGLCSGDVEGKEKKKRGQQGLPVGKPLKTGGHEGWTSYGVVQKNPKEGKKETSEV